jgi:hypothetical protein
VTWRQGDVLSLHHIIIKYYLKLINFNLPNNERTPQDIQIIKLTPTEPVLTSKPDGDTNIPDPKIKIYN